MSINVVVSGTAAGVSVSGGTSVAITVGGGIGPAGFLVAPGTATNAFGTFQLTAGDGITISTSAAQFQISSYGTTAVSSFAPVQSVAGRVGSVVLQASDVTAGTFATARIPTISYTALSNVPATFSPSAHTHSTSDVVSFTAAAAAAAPVQSVAGRSGAVSLAVADISGLAAVASSGSYTSLQNVPATFAPSAHTHSTADITGITGSFAAASHTHDAAAITSGVLELARIPTIGFTALAGVPSTFSPQAHTHGTADVVGLTASFSQVGHTHDYAATIHTHSTADITGYSSLPAQGGKAGPLVTDGTAATWTTRYSVVDPVLVQGSGMTLTRDTSAGSITVAFAGGTSGVSVSSATPQPLGTASAGSSGDASRADHVHLMPSAADVGAAATGHSHPYVQVLNGLTGTLTIAGGSGVTVSTASSSITIAAAGGGLSWSAVPASATATGTAGQIAYDTLGNFYICTATNTWVRSSLAAWGTDASFASVSLLLNMEGSGNTFADYSGTPKTITAYYTATQSAAAPKFGSKSLYLNGTTFGAGPYLSVPYSSAFDLSTGDWTVECWAYATALNASNNLFSINGDGASSAQVTVVPQADGSAYFLTQGAGGGWLDTTLAAAGTFLTNTWQHVAAVRAGDVFRLYVNGTSVISFTSSSALLNASGLSTIGARLPAGNAQVGSQTWQGYIDEFRVTKGVARYSGASLSVPVAAFPTS